MLAAKISISSLTEVVDEPELTQVVSDVVGVPLGIVGVFVTGLPMATTVEVGLAVEVTVAVAVTVAVVVGVADGIIAAGPASAWDTAETGVETFATSSTAPMS